MCSGEVQSPSLPVNVSRYLGRGKAFSLTEPGERPSSEFKLIATFGVESPPSEC